MLILGGFYLANSWQEYREWKAGTIIVVLSLIAVIYGGINLPYFHHNQQAASESSSSQTTKQTGGNSLSFSNKANLNSGSSSAAQQSDREMQVLRQLQKGYAKLGSVSFDESTKTYKIKPTDDNTVQALNALAQDPSQADNIGWPNLTKSIKQNSGQLSQVLGNDYSISIVNPSKSSQAMYTAKNGKTTYDIASQNN